MATALLGSVMTSAVMAEDMTIVSWGGAYSKSQLLAYHQPYVALNPGVNIINDESSTDAIAKLRAMNEANNITWDVVDVVGADSIRACDEGLAIEVDLDTHLAKAPDGTLASIDFGDLQISKCLIPTIVYSTVMGYRSDVEEWNGAEPTSVCDVFDTVKFPGKRALQKVPLNNMEWALLCDGVAKADIYDVLETEAGQTQALAKLDTIKDMVIWWNAGADTPQLLADGEVTMGSAYNGRLFVLIEEDKQPVKILWDAQFLDLDGWIIPAGLPADRLKRALHFVNFSSDTQRLADQSKYISYGPARVSSAPLVGKHAVLGIEMGPHMPLSPENAYNLFVTNFSWWADYRDDLDARFNTWLAK